MWGISAHCETMVVSCTYCLGKPSQQHAPVKPQRLPVQLRNEEIAANLHQSSRLLRADQNPCSRCKKYNPDITSADATLTFQKREKKRQRRVAQQKSRNNNSDTCMTNCDTFDRPTAYRLTLHRWPLQTRKICRIIRRWTRPLRLWQDQSSKFRWSSTASSTCW